MKICDVTQFYSPLSGGVKRYLHEKIAYIERARLDCEQVLIVPGAKTEIHSAARSRSYTIASPVISRRTRYRALLNLRALEEVIERERPDIIECADPYQVGWKCLSIGGSLGIPVVAFYHSHFSEAYLRRGERVLGRQTTALLLGLAQAYVRTFYNRFARTLVPSEPLTQLLKNWGIRGAITSPLGVNTETFRPWPDDRRSTRATLKIPADAVVLLYVGRLAAEKNTKVLCAAFEQLRRGSPRLHLCIVGDGGERDCVAHLQRATGQVTWIRYCADSERLAQFYRAADLFVHPGVQETFGLVALESQACGTPVLGISGSYLDGIIQHDQGFWAQADSADALAGAIEAAATLDLEGVGHAAAAMVAERYSWTRVFERLFSVYQQVCTAYKGIE